MSKSYLSIITNWPEESREAAERLADYYGDPDEATDSLLIWNNSKPWQKTIISKKPVEHRFPTPHQDMVEQFINYPVPPDKFDELAKFDGSVIAERTKGVLSARCGGTSMNFLAVNLAVDILKTKKMLMKLEIFMPK
jgi:hypothetical protein